MEMAKILTGWRLYGSYRWEQARNNVGSYSDLMIFDSTEHEDEQDDYYTTDRPQLRFLRVSRLKPKWILMRPTPLRMEKETQQHRGWMQQLMWCLIIPMLPLLYLSNGISLLPIHPRYRKSGDRIQ